MHFRLRSFSGSGPFVFRPGPASFRVPLPGWLPDSGHSRIRDQDCPAAGFGRFSDRTQIATLPPRFRIYSCSGVPKGYWFACTSSKRMPFS